MIAKKFTLSALPSSASGVVHIDPSKTVQEATSIMLLNDYSQLPVMSNTRKVHGIISWKSIGTCTHLGSAPQFVRDCMIANFSTLRLNDNLLRAVGTILEEEFVLIKDRSNEICGICTIADIAGMFLDHSEPFIEIEQIELAIREWLAQQARSGFVKIERDGASIEIGEADVADLTFGDYVACIENRANWTRLNTVIDRKVLVEKLRAVNGIRNKLMHFRPDGLNDKDRIELHRVSKFFRTFHKLRSV